jgi:ketose-bisphosphate aldolase
MSDANQIIQIALANHFVIPAFNIPHLPMMEPVVRALKDTDSFGLVDVARLEWIKFQAQSPEAVAAEYGRVKDERHTRLHLDHIPVIDEDGKTADWQGIIRRALDAGYQSVMIDGSRLPLEENIAATRWVCEAAHAYGAPVEGELGAVLGHEEGPLPPYEELFASGKGFTDPDEAERFVRETGVDWLSIAFGNVHGAITPAERKKEKVPAKLSIQRLLEIRSCTQVPVVLHGGSGIRREYVRRAIENGVAKINIASDIRRAYEAEMDRGEGPAKEAVYRTTRELISGLEIDGTAAIIAAELGGTS